MKSINLFILVFLLTGCNINLPFKKNDSVVIDIYAFNDLHGRISENDNEPGISKLSSFLKNKNTSIRKLRILLYLSCDTRLRGKSS